MVSVLWVVLGFMVVVNVCLVVRLRLLSGEARVSDTKLPIVGQEGMIKMIYRDDRLLVEMHSQEGSFDVVCEIQSFPNGLPKQGGLVKVLSVSGRIVVVNQLINKEVSSIESLA